MAWANALQPRDRVSETIRDIRFFSSWTDAAAEDFQAAVSGSGLSGATAIGLVFDAVLTGWEAEQAARHLRAFVEDGSESVGECAKLGYCPLGLSLHETLIGVLKAYA